MLRNLPEVTQLVSGRATVHTQLCLMRQPLLSTSCDQNIAEFCSRALTMTYSPPSALLLGLPGEEVADLVIFQPMFNVWGVYHPAR